MLLGRSGLPAPFNTKFYYVSNRSWEPDYLEDGSVEYSREQGIGVEPFICEQKYSFQFGKKHGILVVTHYCDNKVQCQCLMGK